MLVPLTGGFYESKSLIADAQRCVNLYPEKNPPDSPFPLTHYPTPGLIFQDFAVNTSPEFGATNVARGLYRASNGVVFAVYGQTLLQIQPDGLGDVEFIPPSLGNLVANLTTPVSMSDNGLCLVIVDGTTAGYCLDLKSLNFAQIPSSPQGPFYGADKVDYCDTFFLFNRPDTNQWYISLSDATFEMMTTVVGSIMSGSFVGGSGYTDGTYLNTLLTGGSGEGVIANIIISGGIVTSVQLIDAGQGYVPGDSLSALTSVIGSGTGFAYEVLTIGGAFDLLDIATKNGAPDNITSLIVMHREVWLVGVWTTEVWYDSGAADFAFQAMPGAFIEHGCVAKYSLAAQDLSVYFLSQDRQGQAIVLKGSEYQVRRISTHALEQEFAKYATISDAIGFTYQQEGHTFYVLIFPSADKTWVYDEATNFWHERTWIDTDGIAHRIRPNCYAFTEGFSIVGDWQNDSLYTWDSNSYRDEMPFQENSKSIERIRGFPHLLNNSKRVAYTQFIADVQVATETIDYTNLGISVEDTYPPTIYLRYSDDRGRTFSEKIAQPLGAIGQYLTNVQFRRLGMARDRVFELSFSPPVLVTLNGAYVETEQAET